MTGIRFPGIKCKHAIITPLCRANKGLSALDEALERLKQEYIDLLSYEVNENANFHFILTVAREEEVG